MKLGLNLFVGQLIAMVLVIIAISLGGIFSFYYTNHQSSLNSERLMLEEKEKNLLNQINNHVSMASKAEKSFYAEPNREDTLVVIDNINLAMENLKQLKTLNNYDHKENTKLNSGTSFTQIEKLLKQYYSDYKQSLTLWKKRGFSRESGVGLKLRTIAYSDIRSLIPKYNTQILQALVYKLRWLEYELYLYGNKYIPKIKAVLSEFEHELQSTNLEKKLYQLLHHQLQAFKLQLNSLGKTKILSEDRQLLEAHTKSLSTIISQHSITNYAYLYRTLVYYEMEYRELGQQNKHVLEGIKILKQLKLRVQNATINFEDKNKLIKAIGEYKYSFLFLVDLDLQISTLKETMTKTLMQLDYVLESTIKKENLVIKEMNKQAVSKNNNNTKINIIIMLILLSFTILLISWIVRRLGAKVKKIGSSLAQISAGDLNLQMKLPDKSKRDELDWISQHVMDVSKKLTISIDTLKKRNIELEIVSNKLAKYLSPQVYKSIFSGQKSVQIQSGRKKLSVFFSDIVGFTHITDTLESEELTIILNEYLNEMSKIALEYGGTIDKFIGDAIMIFFGDPQTQGQKQDSINCVSMAIAMQNKISQLTDQWQNTHGFSHEFQVRMGVATGYCTVGNFGSEERMDYTIIGGIVNLASRLEHSANAGQILVSQETYTLVKEHILCIKQNKIQLKGIAEAIQTYQAKGNIKSHNKKTNIFEQSGLGFNIKITPELLTETENIQLLKYLKQLIHKL